jgi:hypothetical protein
MDYMRNHWRGDQSLLSSIWWVCRLFFVERFTHLPFNRLADPDMH